MSTFFIQQFGCRATQADAAAIERQLREQGCSLAPDSSSADVVVINTCTVTAAADSQARDAIRKIHARNPNAQVVVTGCYAQRAPEELAALPGVAWVVGNSHKPQIPDLVNALSSPVPRSSASPAFVPASDLSSSMLADLHNTPDVNSLSIHHAPAKILTGNIFEQTSLL